MAGWICSGIPRDNKPHPEQHTSGKHEPYENFGEDCVICGLSKETTGSGGGKLPVKAIAAVITGLMVLGVLGASYSFFKPCQSGEQKRNGECVAITPTPAPSPTPSPTDSPSPDPSSTIAPAAPVTTYPTFTDVPNVPKMNVRYGGSTSFAPLRSPETETRLGQAHPGFDLIYTEPSAGEKPGSGIGIRMLIDGQLSVAQSSRPLKDEEYTQAKTRGFALEQYPIAIDGIAIYVNRQLSIPGLTAAQLKDIYLGRVTNWSQLGGPNLAITPYSRDPKDSGTAEFFREHVLGKDQPFGATIKFDSRDTTGYIRLVADTQGGIGYATASEVCNQGTVRSLPLAKGKAFVEPCAEKRVNQSVFKDDSYPITRRLFVIIKRDGTLDEQAGVAYTNLLLSDQGQQIVNDVGLVRIR